MTYSAIFQAGGLIVVVVEVTRKAYLASLVPVIVDAVLNEHQVVADIVAFVSHGDFPRSRLGEKQRGKVLASWVTRKLRTIAQFSIRDMEGSDNPFAETPQHRMSRISKPGSTMGNSIRHSTMNPEIDPLPRSPAGVTLEETIHPEATYSNDVPPPMPHELDTTTDNAMAANPVPPPNPTVPYVKEPQSATLVTEFDDSHHDTLDQVDGNPGADRDFRFSFDMVNTPMAPQSQGFIPPGSERPSTGRESLPSQQGWDYSNAPTIGTAQADPTRPGTQDSGLIDDWPQEALMYQSALGEDSQDLHTTNSHGAPARRYDGSGYNA
jgi:hypothetical protein